MLAAFDLEIAKSFPEYQCVKCLSDDVFVRGELTMCNNCGNLDKTFLFRPEWKNNRPLGISCAAVYFEDRQLLEFCNYEIGKSSEDSELTKDINQDIVNHLLSIVDMGYTLVGFNSLSFDFDVLAEESGMYKECSELALNHIDLMMIVVTLRGHYLGLDKAAKGASIQGKLHEVTLTDGTKLTDMSGGKAPGLWKAGEYQAVLDYLADDVRSTLELAQWIEKHKMIRWISERGFEQKIHVPKLYTVRECLELDPILPDWVTNPVDRKSMMEWIK